jgi:hypothetical protein
MSEPPKTIVDLLDELARVMSPLSLTLLQCISNFFWGHQTLFAGSDQDAREAHDSNALALGYVSGCQFIYLATRHFNNKELTDML